MGLILEESNFGWLGRTPSLEKTHFIVFIYAPISCVYTSIGHHSSVSAATCQVAVRSGKQMQAPE